MVKAEEEENGRFTVYFSDCKKGLGMKICGGVDENGNHVGIFVKEIMDNGVAASSGEISVGDGILHVNGQSLENVTQIEAISFLRMASQTGSVLLVLDKTAESRKNFLIHGQKQKRISSSSSSSSIKKIEQRKSSIESSVSFNLGNEEPYMENDMKQPSTIDKQPSNRMNISRNYSNHLSSTTNKLLNTYSPSGDSGLPTSPQLLSPDASVNWWYDHQQVITIAISNSTSLGISITGGKNHPGGPNVYISDILTGGDVYKNGELCIGDMLISINNESFIDITHEQAKSILTRLKIRTNVSSHLISFIQKPEVQFIPRALETSSKTRKPKVLPSLPFQSATASPSRHSHMSDSRDDPLLKELLNLMADIQESDAGSILDNDVFQTGPYSPVVKSPHLKILSPRHNTISHYLNKDVTERTLIPKRDITIQRKSNECFSLDPSTIIKVEKLETALKHLGLHPTLAEQNEIRRTLKQNERGEVLYGDFVEAAREVLKIGDLDDHTEILRKATRPFSTSAVEDPSNTALEMSYRDDISRIRRERDDALREVHYFRASLHEKDRNCLELQDDLDRSKQEISSLRNEFNTLRHHTRHGEDSKQIQNDYVKVIKKLEKEVELLRSEHVQPQEEFVEQQKRLVVLGCQLRKTEISKRTYEVAVDKLTKFVENMHVSLESESKRRDNTQQNSKKLNKKIECLSNGARETVKSVKMLLEEEPLPFGWEEVYVNDGTRYYMNHVTQTTSWTHPISGVRRSPKK